MVAFFIDRRQIVAEMNETKVENKGFKLEERFREILKFVVGRKRYAISVTRVKEILPLTDLTPVPNAPRAILGMTLIRGEVVVVVDMQNVLEGYSRPEDGLDQLKILLCEFEDKKIAFCVDQVIGIHRVEEEQVHMPDKLISTTGLVANIEYEGIIYMLLDLSKVLEEVG